MDNNECDKCLARLKIWSLVVSLFLSLIKALIGILGSCEALIADGLYSLYQSFIIAKSIFIDTSSPNSRKDSHKPVINKLDIIKSLYLAGMIIITILVLGIIDVTVFSIVRIIKVSKGLLVSPSPYSLYAAVLSILSNQIFYRYSLCLNKNPIERPCKTNQLVPESLVELNQSYKLSIIISTIALIGVTLARISWLYADALAAIVISIILTVCTIGLLKTSSKTITDLVLLGKM